MVKKSDVKKPDVEVEDEKVVEADLSKGVPANASKTNLLSVIMKSLGDKDKDWLCDFFEKSIAGIDNLGKGVPEGAHAKNMASVQMHKTVGEDLAAIFGDNADLTEEFKTKTASLFESAVDVKVALVKAELEEAAEAELAEQVEQITEALEARIDTYLTHISEKWLEDNAVAIENALTTESCSSFIEGLKVLFQEHYYEVPEDKADAVEVLTAKVGELEEKYNEALNMVIELTESETNRHKDELVAEASKDMTVNAAANFKKLAEGLDYEAGQDDKFREKLTLLKDKKPATTDTNITEEANVDKEKAKVIEDKAIESYSKAISRTVQK